MTAIPPKPATFDPAGAPAGCEVKFVPQWQNRPLITPRLILAHTNAAGREGSIEASYTWASQGGSNTLPHYQVDRQYNSRGVIARKMLPTNRRGIGNGTVLPGGNGWSSLPKAVQNDILTHAPQSVSMFSIVIETADLGYPTPGDVQFTPDQAEMVATIIAYELACWPSTPLAYPETWWGSGVASHTEPFGYPYWTNAKGKTCPGSLKKAQMREQVMPRAGEILTAWKGGDGEEDDMTSDQAAQLAAIFAAVGNPQSVSDAVWHQTVPDGNGGGDSATWAQLVNAKATSQAALDAVNKLRADLVNAGVIKG